MQSLAVKRVTVDTGSLRQALQEIESVMEANSQLRDHILAILELAGEKAPAKRGRPRGSGAAAQTAAGPGPARRGGGRRPRGEKSLKDMVGEVLERSGGGPMRAKELMKAVQAAGYKTNAKPNSFYTAIYTAAKSNPDVTNTDDGFVLANGGGASSAIAGKKTGKKGRKGRKKKAK